MRLASADWAKIRRDYISSNATLEELAQKYGVSFSTLRKRSGKERWRDDVPIVRNKMDQLAQKRLDEELEKFATDFTKNRLHFLFDHEQTRKCLLQKLQEAIRQAETGDLRGIRSLTAAFGDLTRAGGMIHGLGDGNIGRSTVNIAVMAASAAERSNHEPGESAVTVDI